MKNSPNIQFMTKRKYDRITYDSLIEKLKETNKIQELFCFQDPNTITEILLEELHWLVKKLLIIK